jgi:outer membrane cobalamin receptor
MTAVGGLAWSSARGWNLNVDLQWVDDRYVLNPRYAAGEVEVGAYFLANARLSLPLRWLGIHGDGSIFIFGENLTGEEYEYRVGYPMPGRMVQVGLDIPLQ